MKTLLCAITLTTLSAVAFAQAQDQHRWGIGAGAAAIDSPFVGEGTRIRAVPLVSYEGDKFFFRGPAGGYHLVNSPGFSFDVIGSLRLDGFDVEDLGANELAMRGIDRRLLEDRDDQLDAGLGLNWRGDYGDVMLRMLTDVTDRSGGQEISLSYSYRLQLGSFTVTPHVAVSHLSDDLADYYYGTLDEEVARGVIDYKPGDTLIPQVGVNISRPIDKHWVVMGSLRYMSLPDDLSDSPLIDSDRVSTAFVGTTYRF